MQPCVSIGSRCKKKHPTIFSAPPGNDRQTAIYNLHAAMAVRVPQSDTYHLGVYFDPYHSHLALLVRDLGDPCSYC